MQALRTALATGLAALAASASASVCAGLLSDAAYVQSTAASSGSFAPSSRGGSSPRDLLPMQKVSWRYYPTAQELENEGASLRLGGDNPFRSAVADPRAPAAPGGYWPRATRDVPLFGYPTANDSLFDDGTRPAYQQQFLNEQWLDRPSYSPPSYDFPTYGLDPIQKPAYTMPLAIAPDDDKPNNAIKNYEAPAERAPGYDAPEDDGPNYDPYDFVGPRVVTPGYQWETRATPEYLAPTDPAAEYRKPDDLPPPYIAPPE